MNGKFVADLVGLMRSWNWTERQIEDAMPKVIRACLEVGILTREGGELILTELTESDEAWDVVWQKVEKERAGESGQAG